MAVDGYLNFDTKINQKGFAKGLASIGKSVTGWATSVVSTINRVTAAFSKITEAYNTQIEAEARLAATMKNSTGASQKEIQSVKDLAGSLQELGVVGDEVQLAGAQELATYVENTESIKQMLPVLNDMIAQQYGFSASTDSAVTIATMLGKVLQGQTSALSRYGYSFDENQEQLLKFGNEQQRVATLAAVVEQSVAGVNAALADTPTGKIKQLSNDFGDLKETVGKLLSEIVYPLVTYLDVIVKKLNATFSAASGGIKSLFGISDDSVSFGGGSSELADSSADAAENYADIADSAKKAEKANKGSLAAFDELNVLAQEGEDSSGGNAEVLPAAVADTAPVQLTPSIDTTEIEKKTDTFITMITGKLKPLKDAFDKLKTSLQPLKDHIGEGLKWFYDNVLLPLGDWAISEGLPAFIDMLSGFFNLVDKVGSLVGDTLKSLWDNFFSKAASFVGDAVVKIFEALGDTFTAIANSPDAVLVLTIVGEIIGLILAGVAMFKLLTGLLTGIPALIASITNPLGLIIVALIAIGVVIAEVIANWDTLKEGFFMLCDAIKKKLAAFFAAFKETWERSWKSVTDSAARIWEKLKNGAHDAWEGIKGIFSKVGEFFGDVFSKAWNKVKEVFAKGGAIFKGIKDGIFEAFKRVVNSLIDGINNVVALPFDGLNSALMSIRDTDILGHKPFEWLPSIDIPQLPHLAGGTVIPANYGEFAAILGDNKREREFVTPESSMKQAFVEALLEAGLGDSGDTVIQIDGDTIFRITKKHADNYSRTHGGRPAFGAGSAR